MCKNKFTYVRQSLFIVLMILTPAFIFSQLPSSTRSRDAIERQTPKLQKLTDSLGLALGSPIFLRIFKESKELEVWIKKGNRFSLFKIYPICYYSGTLGSKTMTGDGQAPEGFYRITPKAMNPNSRFHLSFNIGFPNSYDRVYKCTGSDIMVHGNCVSIGCYAMGDENIEQIWTLMVKGFEKGQRTIDIHIFPFRMTDQKMKEHSDSTWSVFWTNLKEGYLLFEQNQVPPAVSVKDRKYFFSTGSYPASGSTR
jgi:murein L,D-transpeptidase YafK